MSNFTEILQYTIPGFITGIVAYVFFKEHLENENKKRLFLLKKDLEKETLPTRLQAYERITLFLERISPIKLLLRVQPTSDSSNDYETLLVATIEQEFEHNLSQQIYVTADCWTHVNSAKNTTIQLIRSANINEKTATANKLREHILNSLMDKLPPNHAALNYIKNEVQSLWG